MVSPVSRSPQVATPLSKESSLKKIVQNNQPTILHHHRQNLLGERKQGLQVTPQRRQIKPVTIFNQHSHLRQESPRSDSAPLDHYISRVIYSKDWLLKWIDHNWEWYSAHIIFEETQSLQDYTYPAYHLTYLKEWCDGYAPRFNPNRRVIRFGDRITVIRIFCLSIL